MKLDKELFLELCEKYGVEFSDQYNDIMYKDQEGNIKILGDDELNAIFL